MPTETRPFDAAAYLTTPEDQAAYLSEALAENDPLAFRHALGIIARAQGMADVAERAELNRESLYRSLSDAGNPRFDTMNKVLGALGLQLSVRPISADG